MKEKSMNNEKTIMDPVKELEDARKVLDEFLPMVLAPEESVPQGIVKMIKIFRTQLKHNNEKARIAESGTKGRGHLSEKASNSIHRLFEQYKMSTDDTDPAIDERIAVCIAEVLVACWMD